MGKFRKRPVVVEAVQLNFKNWSEICEFADVGKLEDGKPTGGWVTPIGSFHNQGGPPVDGCVMGLAIPTLEGLMIAKEGDWIIKGIKGELYPCKRDIFEASYEPLP